MLDAMRTVALVSVLLVSFSGHSVGCECRISGKVSKYLKTADVVFLGKVTFTDDDGSGTFRQQTFIHFQIEEAFKGLANEVHDVWADPGSFTSCYAEYLVGEQYLVFASGGAKMPMGTAAVSTVPQPSIPKPLPAGIDPANPPTVYYAPECTGTLHLPQDQVLLRSWLKDLQRYRKREAQ